MIENKIKKKDKVLGPNIGLNIHNKFDIYVTDIRNGKKEKVGQAENIVLDRLYSRLLDFNTYFVNIVYGEGTGTPSPDRTTLFTRIGSKTATEVELVRDYPTSKWTKMIQLGTADANGKRITEVGISDTTTNINTHAMLKDAEGADLSIDKTEFLIVDIYATVYVSVFSVDDYLYISDDGLRNYLTGGSAPSNAIYLKDVTGFKNTSITATRTKDTSTNTLKWTGRFNIGADIGDVGMVEWAGGVIWRLPYPGVFDGVEILDKEIGIGDGDKKNFYLPFMVKSGLKVYVDNVLVTNYTSTGKVIKFETAPGIGLTITVDYTTKFLPKTSNNVLDVDFRIQFGIGQPSPGYIPPGYPNLNAFPGPKSLVGGDTGLGFYGEADAEDMITGEDLCVQIGLSAGILQYSDEPWLKFIKEGEIRYVAKKTYRANISWNNINSAGAVSNQAYVVIDNMIFTVSLLSTEEWDEFMYPIHKDHPGGAPSWAEYTDCDLHVHSSCGNGSYTWTSTASGSFSRVPRGYSGVTNSGADNPSHANAYYGFRPVLRYLMTL